MKITRRTMLLVLCVLALFGGAAAVFYFARNPVEPSPTSKPEPGPRQRVVKGRPPTNPETTKKLKELAVTVARPNGSTKTEVKRLALKKDAELLVFITASTKEIIDRGELGWDFYCGYIANELRGTGKHDEALDLIHYGIEMGEKRAISSDVLARFDWLLGSVLDAQENIMKPRPPIVAP
jgi:hypothetical protein